MVVGRWSPRRPRLYFPLPTLCPPLDGNVRWDSDRPQTSRTPSYSPRLPRCGKEITHEIGEVQTVGEVCIAKTITPTPTHPSIVVAGEVHFRVRLARRCGDDVRALAGAEIDGKKWRPTRTTTTCTVIAPKTPFENICLGGGGGHHFPSPPIHTIVAGEVNPSRVPPSLLGHRNLVCVRFDFRRVSFEHEVWRPDDLFMGIMEKQVVENESIPEKDCEGIPLRVCKIPLPEARVFLWIPEKGVSKVKGGRLWCRSRLPHGLRLIILWPLASAASRRSGKSEKKKTKKTKKTKKKTKRRRRTRRSAVARVVLWWGKPTLPPPSLSSRKEKRYCGICSPSRPIKNTESRKERITIRQKHP